MLMPAIETAIPWPWYRQPKLARKLAKSLVCYVIEDDVVLSRAAFLRTVIDRMQSDLNHGEQ